MSGQVSWRNSQVLSLLVLVFVAGGLSGAFAYRMVRMMRHQEPAPNVIGNLADKQSSLTFLSRELVLTPEQVLKVSAILDDYKRYYGNIQDQFEEVRATGKNRIVGVLDPAQREKFERLVNAGAKVNGGK